MKVARTIKYIITFFSFVLSPAISNAQDWWIARDVPGVGVWSDVDESSGQLDFVIGSNSVPASYPSEQNQLTQCRRADAERTYWHSDQHYRNFHSFRINNVNQRPSPSTSQAGVKLCEKQFDGDWYVLVIVEPWVKAQEECNGMTYTSGGNVLEINRCLRLTEDDLPAPKYQLTWELSGLVGEEVHMDEGQSLFTRVCVDRIMLKNVEIKMLNMADMINKPPFVAESDTLVILKIFENSYVSDFYEIPIKSDRDASDEGFNARLVYDSDVISVGDNLLGEC